jgi:transcriptional regulator with XRE-family HTH domain
VPAPIEGIYKAIGRNIAQQRARVGISQAELGKKISPPRSRAVISNLEAGRQRILVHALLEIARVLRTSPAELLLCEVNLPPPSVLEDELRGLSVTLSRRTIAQLTREVFALQEKR